jgi:DNA-binding NarL/FixJ family response regulator
MRCIVLPHPGRKLRLSDPKEGNGFGVDVLIADEHELVRRGLISILGRSHPEWRIVANVASGAAAIEAGIALRPNVAIVDLALPDISGLQVAERLSEAIPGICILLLTMPGAASVPPQLKRPAVSAYLDRSEAPKMLVAVVERLLSGESFETPASTARPGGEAPGYVPVQFLLTPRELEVFRLLARGRTNKEIAAELNIGVRTVESHRAHISAKLKVETLADLVRIAVRDGVT